MTENEGLHTITIKDASFCAICGMKIPDEKYLAEEPNWVLLHLHYHQQSKK